MHISRLYSWAQPKYVADSLATFPSTSYTLAEPYGLVLIIGTWNFPLTLSLMPLVGAISSGNTCILKLSNTSAYTTKLLSELINKYIPQDV